MNGEGDAGMTVIVTHEPEATEAAGERLGRRLAPGDAVLLIGELAAGKTTLVRGLAAGVGADPAEVDSPTFVLVQTYPCRPDAPVRRLHHVDLYRIRRPGELDTIGLEELLSETDAVCAIEWPRDLLTHRLPPATPVWAVRLEALPGGVRRITITPPPER